MDDGWEIAILFSSYLRIYFSLFDALPSKKGIHFNGVLRINKFIGQYIHLLNLSHGLGNLVRARF